MFQPIYTHNFALELYNKFHETSVTTDNSLQICLSSIKSLFFLSIEDDSANPETKMEIYSTAILASFLFPDDIFTKGAVFHQLCSRKQPNKPDIGEAPDIYISTISTTQDDSSLPDKILLVGDWKKSEFGTACTETHGYALTIFEGKYQQRPGCVFLGLAGTANHYKLFLYRPCNNHLHAIELVEGFCLGRAKATVGKLLRVMKYAIEEMRTKPIISRDCTLHCCCDGDHRMLHDNIIDSYSGNVVRQAKVVYCVKNNYVYKYYDCETEIVTCTYETLDHLVELMKGLPKYTSLDLALESLSNCKRFARVKCRYIEQSDISHHSKNQAIMLLETLKSLHSLGYVHSDVRKNNILFDDTNDEAYLIDFDLCDKEDVNYPKVYNHASISERHKDASADKPRKKIHDVFSILKILQEAEFLQCYPVVDDIDAVRLLDELIEKLKN